MSAIFVGQHIDIKHKHFSSLAYDYVNYRRIVKDIALRKAGYTNRHLFPTWPAKPPKAQITPSISSSVSRASASLEKKGAVSLRYTSRGQKQSIMAQIPSFRVDDQPRKKVVPLLRNLYEYFPSFRSLGTELGVSAATEFRWAHNKNTPQDPDVVIATIEERLSIAKKRKEQEHERNTQTAQ